MKLGLPIGISTGFWFIIGLVRTVVEKYNLLPTKYYVPPKWAPNCVNVIFQYMAPPTEKDIAVVLAAHNEEMVVRECIKALKQSIPAKNIHVASDGSEDNTAKEAKSEKVKVLEINPGIGKAKAIMAIINKYDLYNQYRYIFIIDADTKIDKQFVPHALKFLRDPNCGVVFATARIHWPRHIIPSLRYYFIAYRERLNRMMQFFLIYGMTWKYTNASFVIPGFCTIYKSEVLQQLKIDTPGLLIEDFNLAFQFHKRKLGTMGYDPQMFGWDQHPDNLRDYWKQVRRWNIGFFQTLRINGVWPSFFSVTMMMFTIEVFLHSIFIFALPFVALYTLTQYFADTVPFFANYKIMYESIGGPFQNLGFEDIVIGYWWMDYAMTVVFGFMTKKPQFIIYGLFFFILHFITALILMSAVIPGFFSKSQGRWVSPKRHKG